MKASIAVAADLRARIARGDLVGRPGAARSRAS